MIQGGTPTVGEIMKSAVKKVTCLGCNAPLQANNGVSSACRLCRPSHHVNASRSLR